MKREGETMKFNLKNRPKPPSEIAIVTGREPYDYAEKWFEGFEKQLREKLEGIQFVLKDSPRAPWFLGVQDMVKEILGDQK